MKHTLPLFVFLLLVSSAVAHAAGPPAELTVAAEGGAGGAGAAGPAAARAPGAATASPDARAYLGGQAGMFLPIESAVSGGGLNGKLSYHPGLVLTLLAGYQFANGLRGEAEGSFRTLDTDRLSAGAASVPVRSDIWTAGFMTNLYYDFRNRTPVTPYLGGGAGLLLAHFGRGTSNGTTLWDSDRDLTFAYQGIAGFALRIAPRTSLDLVYHHYAVPSLHFDTLAAKFRGINLSAGFRHWF